MSVFPLEFRKGDVIANYRITGEELIDIRGLDQLHVGNNAIAVELAHGDGQRAAIPTNLRIDSEQELAYLRNGGILPYVVRKNATDAQAAA